MVLFFPFIFVFILEVLPNIGCCSCSTLLSDLYSLFILPFSVSSFLFLLIPKASPFLASFVAVEV